MIAFEANKQRMSRVMNQKKHVENIETHNLMYHMGVALYAQQQILAGMLAMGCRFLNRVTQRVIKF